MSPFPARLIASGVALLAAANAFSAESHSLASIVIVNGVPVLKLVSSSGGISSEARASSISKSLRFATADDSVKVINHGQTAVIKVGPVTIGIDSIEASKQNKSTPQLASLWAQNIREALSLPEIKFGEEDLLVPTGTEKSVSFVGSLAYLSSVSTSNPAVVIVTKKEGQLKLKFIGVGDADVVAESGNTVRRLPIRVRNVASKFPQTLTVDVVGDPAIGSMVTASIEGALRTNLDRVSGAKISFAPFQADALGPGKSKTYSVWTRVTSKDCFTGTGPVEVKVSNLVIGKHPEGALWYSNTPESVRQTGNLFAAFLKVQSPVRFLYHHINASSQPLLFRVEAINDSDTSARVIIQSADARPDKNPVVAGMAVAIQFLKYWVTQSGEVVTIPPHSTLPISFRRLSPTETTSGLCTLNMLSGPSELQVRADALPPFELNEDWYNATFSSTPWHMVAPRPIDDYDRATYERSDHIYPNPFKIENLEYEVGGRFGTIMIGQKPISGEDHTNNLDGNYGVLYTIHTTLTNQTASSADVELLMESSAGYTGGLFWLNGQMIQSPYLGPKATFRICKISLPPKSVKVFELQTVPISGGAYPATVTARPIEVSK